MIDIFFVKDLDTGKQYGDVHYERKNAMKSLIQEKGLNKDTRIEIVHEYIEV